MTNRMVVFNITNNQEKYAHCLHIMKSVKEKRMLCETPLLEDEVKVFCSDRQWEQKDITDLVEGKRTFTVCDGSEIEVNDKICYHFNIKCADETDIINLVYYCLVYDWSVRTDTKCSLCVACNQKQGANIRDFLTWLLDAGTIKDCYTYIDEKCYRISNKRLFGLKHALQKDTSTKRTDSVRIMKQFSPIFNIDEKTREGKYGSVTFWRQPMRVFLGNLYQSMNRNEEKIPVGETAEQNSNYTGNYFLPHICPSHLRTKHEGEEWQRVTCPKEQHLLSNFVECFCTIQKGQSEREGIDSAKLAEDKYKLWKSKEFFEYVKEMPLLAMYIFCISDYFLRDDDSREKLEQRIFDARDMADGLLQILENIYHSEKGRGYFCFRVHTDSKDRSERYLRQEYKAYMESWKERKTLPKDYLEIKVVDLSHCSIPSQFYLDYRKRMEQAEENEKEIYKKLDSQAAALKVSSFFDKTSAFWNEYNKISENIVHHYGLQVFESLVSCYDGYFRVRSQETEKTRPDTDLYTTLQSTDIPDHAIPGTQYDILIPFRKQRQMQDISLNVNINYTDALLKEYDENICKYPNLMELDFDNISKELKDIQPDISYQEQKEKIVQALADAVNFELKKVSDRNWILHFSAEHILMSRIELFCKAVMLGIAHKEPEQNFNLMITECTRSHFIEITRMFALFYNKQGINSLMKNTQIFMSGQNEQEEFLITGVNLGEAVGSTEKLAFARCTPPDCLKILKKMLANHKMGANPNEIVTIVPFDMINYDSGKRTLLERRLEHVLIEDVQSTRFGCRLRDLHVRIGSKIHIRTFFEAELLFHNNYYTSRFAYWLYNELRGSEELDLDRPFVLIGCENYSEMLLNELCDMFGKAGIETEYLIYEERIAGKFRGKRPLDRYKNHQFIIIVPINSTLTTHIKIHGFLKKKIRDRLQESGDTDYESYNLTKVLNYGIVLIYPEKENNYWERVPKSKNVIRSKLNGNVMKYYIGVLSKWENPLECKACFPDEAYTEELPMVETNKESIVPMHAIGIRKEHRISGMPLASEEDRIEDLSKFLVYKHIERNGNHFNYYFETEKLWDFPDVRNKVRQWLVRKKDELFGKEQCKVYDIIVAPLHYSNTVFVEEVNGSLFKNAALVLHFDADREFRMNVRAKYSSIQQLYDNLNEDDEESIINFHYVDDTIISGRTFRRMKTLIGSMIEERENSNVQINVFKSIVLLLNRMSKASISDYIEEHPYYLAYFNLKISSMRVNSDACVLCKKYAEWNKLAQQASLNKVYSHWRKKGNRLACIPVEKLEERLAEERDQEYAEERAERNKQYMLASHRAKTVVDDVCDYKDKEGIQKEIVDQLFPNDVINSIGELIAMLKVLGRPFLSFRKEEKEAVFGLMLIMLDALLAETAPTGEEKIDVLLRQIWEKDDLRTKVVTVLMNRLAELESNYLIRKCNITKILYFCENHISDLDEQRTFTDNYLNRVKQLVGQSNDFAKGLFLEYLLLYGEEYRREALQERIVPICGDDSISVFKKSVYLENTKLVNYGIEYLAESFSLHTAITQDGLITVLNENYYFDNFIQYLMFHQMIGIDENEKVREFVSKTEYLKIEGMVRFELLYQRIFKKNRAAERRKPMAEDMIKDTFTEMMGYLRDAGGAVDGEIIVPYGNEQEGKKYIALELGKSPELRSLENNERILREFMNRNSRFEEDTYAICNAPMFGYEDSKWIMIQFVDNTCSGQSDIPVIYMLFPFHTNDENELIHALKNILIFRYKIWKILNLSSNILLKNWTDNLFYKQQMLKSRAANHSELDTLMEEFRNLAEQICNGYKDKSDDYKLLCRQHFSLLVDSMIGAMNVKVLGNCGTESRESDQHDFIHFWEAQRAVNGAIREMWDIDIKLSAGDFSGCRLRCGTAQENGEKIYPSFEVLRILMLIVFQNVKKHGQRNEKQMFQVTFSVRENQIWISNRVDQKNKAEIEAAIRKEGYRSSEGISQAVIYDICKSWYQDTKYDEIFEFGPEKNDGNEWLYVVKLPIIERRDENE